MKVGPSRKCSRRWPAASSSRRVQASRAEGRTGPGPGWAATTKVRSLAVGQPRVVLEPRLHDRRPSWPPVAPGTITSSARCCARSGCPWPRTRRAYVAIWVLLFAYLPAGRHPLPRPPRASWTRRPFFREESLGSAHQM
jgi:hypothetical protein